MDHHCASRIGAQISDYWFTLITSWEMIQYHVYKEVHVRLIYENLPSGGSLFFLPLERFCEI